MRTNKIEKLQSRDCWLVWPHHGSDVDVYTFSTHVVSRFGETHSVKTFHGWAAGATSKIPVWNYIHVVRHSFTFSRVPGIHRGTAR